MHALTRIEELAGIPGPLFLAIGVFDGVHLGHRAVTKLVRVAVFWHRADEAFAQSTRVPERAPPRDPLERNGMSCARCPIVTQLKACAVWLVLAVLTGCSGADGRPPLVDFEFDPANPPSGQTRSILPTTPAAIGI